MDHTSRNDRGSETGLETGSETCLHVMFDQEIQVSKENYSGEDKTHAHLLKKIEH